LDLLRDERRRYALAVLSTVESQMSLDELAESVAARELRAGADDVRAETVDQVALTLHHVHLSKLSEFDIVDYDSQTNVVTPTCARELTPFLEAPDAPGE
jgi:hypothetical protein